MNIIADETQLKLFYDQFLSAAESTEEPKSASYMIYLSARKKYDPELTSAYECFNRRILTNITWEKFLRTLRNMEAEAANYPVTQKSLACYISLNCRDTETASKELYHSMTDYFVDHQGKFKPNALLTQYENLLQKHGIRQYLVLDLDVKDMYDELMTEIATFNVIPKTIIETHGGYHLVFTVDSFRNAGFGRWVNTVLPTKTFSAVSCDGKNITKQCVDKLSNPFCPLPGTYQGGF